MVGKDQGLRYLCLNSSQLVNSWREKEDPSSYSKRTTTISELFIVKLSVRYIYILLILSQHLWIPYMYLMRNFAAWKKQTTLHASSYWGYAFGLCIRHPLVNLHYYFINVAFFLLWKVYLKTFQDGFRFRLVPSVAITVDNFMLKERKDLMWVRLVGEIWYFQLMG